MIPPDRKAQALPAGTKAPDFLLKSTPDQKVSLSEFRGQRVVLVFFPAAFSPVCGDEMSLFNQILPEFQKHSACVIGISCDNVWSLVAFSKLKTLRFPLLSDFHPKGAVSHLYGVFDDKDGVCDRALFLIDENGIIRWSYVSPVGVNPGADGVLEALEEMEKETATAR